MRGNRVDNWMISFWLLVCTVCALSLLLSIFWTLGSPEEINEFLNKWKLVEYYENVANYSFAIFSVSTILLLFKLFSWFRKRSHSNKMDDFFFKITTLTDEEAVSSLQSLGLAVSSESMQINVKVFDYASPEALSHAVTFLLYLESRDSLDEWLIGKHTVFHHLADILLENAHDESIKHFVAYMKTQKIYLGQLLDSALVRRELEHEVNQLSEKIAEVIEQERSVLQHAHRIVGIDLSRVKQIIPGEVVV